MPRERQLWFVKSRRPLDAPETRELYRQTKYFLACNQHSLGTEESQFVLGRELEVVDMAEKIPNLELRDVGLNHSPATY